MNIANQQPIVMASACPALSSTPLPNLLGAPKPAGFPRLSDIRNVAIIRLDDIGDLVLTSPLLREMRRNLPQARISLAINPTLRNLVERCPYVNRVIDVPTQRRGGGWGEIEHLGVLVDHVVRHWWPERCDLAVLPRYGADLHDARLLAWLSRARWRVGFDEPDFHILKHKRMGLSGPRLLNVRLKRDGALPEVIRNLSVLESIGGNIIRDDLELWTSDDDARHAESLVGGNNGDPLIAICPSGRYPRKRWPIARFETVIERLLTSPRAVRLVLIGGPGDRLLVRTLLERFGAHLLDLTGTLTLRQTAAVLGHCALYIGCDTGPMHLAAAAGASVVEISCHPLEGDPSGEYSPLRFGPWKTPAIVLQPRAVSPCTSTCSADEAHCILGISVDDVMDAANRLLETPRASRPL